MKTTDVKRGVYVRRSTIDSAKPEYVVVENDTVWFQEKFNGRDIGVVGIIVLFRKYQCLSCRTMAMQLQVFRSQFNFVTRRIVTKVERTEAAMIGNRIL